MTQTHDTHDRTYHTLLRTIAYNTGDPQPPLVDAGALWTVAVANGSLSHTDAATAMQAARENGHVIRWRDGDGHLRYGLTGDGIGATPDLSVPEYGPADVGAFRTVIETEASREDPDRDVIGWANARLQAIDSDT